MDKQGPIHTVLVGTIVPLLSEPYQSYTLFPEVALLLEFWQKAERSNQ